MHAPLDDSTRLIRYLPSEQARSLSGHDHWELSLLRLLPSGSKLSGTRATGARDQSLVGRGPQEPGTTA